MTDLSNNHGVIPGSGHFSDIASESGLIFPTKYSTGGWTVDDKGYKQQTFLGASIRSFSVSAGFGDTSSTLNLELIEDEFNQSDKTPLGQGNDEYHNGGHDKFRPPFVGSPVFFKFGYKGSTVQEAYSGVFDYLYNGTPLPKSGEFTSTGSFDLEVSGGLPSSVGTGDEFYDTEKKETGTFEDNRRFTFGGILQSHKKNRSTAGNPSYSAQIVDPREILDNVELILNNYADSTYEIDNLYNVYGFLEHNATTATEDDLKNQYGNPNPIKRSVDPVSYKVEFTGNDRYEGAAAPVNQPANAPTASYFPMTGTGFARRSEQGIPYYRLRDAINAMFEFEASLPTEYKDMKYGDRISFRGFKYIVDLSGLPELDSFYSLDFDKISLLDLCLEIADVSNKDLLVSLLPVIDHPKCKFVFQENAKKILDEDKAEDAVMGIIYVQAIDRTEPPKVGAVEDYIEDKIDKGELIRDANLGLEVSNVVTDKLIVGAKETHVHYFSGNSDKYTKKDLDEGMNLGQSYKLEEQLKQQIVPYYGTIGQANHISLPRGFGSYQQILLETRGLAVTGVKKYYVTTEMELRCALAGFSQWKQFLLNYQDTYIEHTDADKGGFGAVADNDDIDFGGNTHKQDPDKDYMVTVPRSLFPCYEINTLTRAAAGVQIPLVGNLASYDGEDLETAHCNPPFGYPLYYNRARILGIPEAGIISLSNFNSTQLLKDISKLKESNSEEDFKIFLGSTWTVLKNRIFKHLHGNNRGVADAESVKFWEEVERKIDAGEKLALIEDRIVSMEQTITTVRSLENQGLENAKRVHRFLSEIARDCLGRKYLVKIPKKVNVFYSDVELQKQNEKYKKGPFGFKPLPKVGIEDAIIKAQHANNLTTDQAALQAEGMMPSFLHGSVDLSHYEGALESNYNPIDDSIKFNYTPEPNGGFFNETSYKEIIPFDKILEFGFPVMKNHAAIGLNLAPMDIKPITTNTHRISCYARFSHSQYLNFNRLNSKDFIQEKVAAKGEIANVPVFDNSLENIKDAANNFHAFKDRANKKDQLDETCAFVRCDVSSELYYLPELDTRPLGVFGQAGEKYPAVQKLVYAQNVKDDGTVEEDLMAPYISYFVPPATSAGGMMQVLDYKVDIDLTWDSFGGENIRTKVQSDTEIEHVYALVTLPERIETMLDYRFAPGPQFDFAPFTLSHRLTQDVVKGYFTDALPYANSPNSKTKGSPEGEEATTKIEVAENCSQANSSMLSYGYPQLVDVRVPRAVMPDLVAIPLSSEQRCYGPWNSQTFDDRNEQDKANQLFADPKYVDLGGKVEFFKEESLAPWNYGGYEKMQAAGSLKARFANSRLLLSERGDFTIANTPESLFIGEQLVNSGPLVTNMNVNISDAGVLTTYKLDLYTVNFGKLQNRKERNIRDAGREKQKTLDTTNSLIRNTMGKNQANSALKNLYDTLSSRIDNSEAGSNRGEINANTNLISTCVQDETKGHEVATGDARSIKKSDNNVRIAEKDSTSKVAQSFYNATSASKNYFNSAGTDANQQYTPICKHPEHPHMTSQFNSFNKSKDVLYPAISLENTIEEDLTKYED